ncbi:MAG: hypothetical protein V4671_25635, partial [Armatimonadota bacterium]
GPAGEDGQDGAAATIEIGTVTTLAPGEPATVENVGNENAAVLDFAIPQGAQGVPGPPGEDGADGEDGEPGPPGDGMSFAYQSLGAADPLVLDAVSDYELILQSFTGASHAIALPISPIDKLVSVVNYNSTPNRPLTVTASPEGDYVLPSYSDRALFSFIYGTGWRLVSLTVNEEEVGGGGITGMLTRRNSTGTVIGPRPQQNIVDGNGIAITIGDDSVNNEVDITYGLSNYAGATVGHAPRKAASGALTWAAIPSYNNFGASGPFHAAGLVPDPGATAGNKKVLNENGQFLYPIEQLHNQHFALASVYSPLSAYTYTGASNVFALEPYSASVRDYPIGSITGKQGTRIYCYNTGAVLNTTTGVVAAYVNRNITISGLYGRTGTAPNPIPHTTITLAPGEGATLICVETGVDGGTGDAVQEWIVVGGGGVPAITPAGGSADLATAGYYYFNDIVKLTGQIANSSGGIFASTTVEKFTLPAGYRPPLLLLFIVAGVNNLTGGYYKVVVRVGTDGKVFYHEGPELTNLFFDQICFRPA